ncbi:hypothetical protein [Hyphococcus sp. DH-69]|uniref:hypothetical protein n=1 Tax=Hyphococcus formosus TaxID=3143534 RepID=UPI00398AD49F
MSDADYQADENCFKYFARLETWTREEAGALLLRLDPRIVLARDRISGSRPAFNFRQFCDLLEMLNRAKTALSDGRHLKPEQILNWAKTQGYSPPKELVIAVKAAKVVRQSDEQLIPESDFSANIENQAIASELPKDNVLHHKTKSSMLKLIAGMAVRGYGYNPKLRQNSAITDIETDLRLLNVPLSDDTIRRWVNEACELIDWETIDDDAK